ncbi:MAG: hypothetical protein KIH69_013295 [Anaerolineae bacterium]|nr:hypothetical protein [Anaerolineae bacterium]
MDKCLPNECLEKIQKIALELLGQSQDLATRDAFFKIIEDRFNAYASDWRESKIDEVCLSEINLKVKLLDVNHINDNDESDFRVDGLDLANKNQYLMLLGDPKSGKTSFLKWLGWNVLKSLGDKNSVYKHQCIPVILEIKDDEQVDLIKRICEKFKGEDGNQKLVFVREGLKNGRFLILLDIKSESLSGQKKINAELNAMLAEFGENRFLVATRSSLYEEALPKFVHFCTADFDSEQVRAFVKIWFQEVFSYHKYDESEIEKFLNDLSLPNLQHVSAVANNSYFLPLFCRTYVQSSGFPTKITDLYDKVIKIKLDSVTEGQRILDSRHVYEILSEIAFQMFVESKFVFEKQDILSVIDRSLPQFNAKFLENPKISEVIFENLVTLPIFFAEHSINLFYFRNLTTQYFLVARYIFDSIVPTETEGNDIIEAHICDANWRSVFLLLSEQLKSSDKLVVDITKSASKRIKFKKAYELLKQLNKIIPSSNDKNTVKRSFLFYVAILLKIDLLMVRFLYLFYARGGAISSDLMISRINEIYHQRSRIRLSFLSLLKDLSQNPIENSSAYDNEILLSYAEATLELQKKEIQNFNFRQEGLTKYKYGTSIFFPWFNFQITYKNILEEHIAAFNVLSDERIFGFDEKIAKKIKSLTEEIKLGFGLDHHRKIQNYLDISANSFCELFELKKEWLDLNETETSALLDYLYICELTIQCLKVSNRVSPSIKNEVRSRIFSVPPSIVPNSSHIPGRRLLFDLICKYFTLEDLKILCFKMYIDYENIPNTTLDGKVSELIKYCERYELVPQLVEALIEERPKLSAEFN